MLLNTFDLPEGHIIDSNYTEALRHLNATHPGVIQGLDLGSCDLNTFLSEVTIPQLFF